MENKGDAVTILIEKPVGIGEMANEINVITNIQLILSFDNLSWENAYHPLLIAEQANVNSPSRLST